MLKETYLSNAKNVEGIKFVVMCYYPRGHLKSEFKEWCPELAPSRELLKRYKESEVTTKEFTKEYIKEVLSRLKAISTMVKIYNLAKQKDVWLICKEKPGEFCHRHILKMLIENLLKYVIPYRKGCPFMPFNDPKMRCSLKIKVSSYMGVPSRMKSKGEVIFIHKMGHPTACDFIACDVLKGNRLKDCIWFTNKTKFFSCRTCFYAVNSAYCLKHGKRVQSNFYCKQYIEKFIRFGNLNGIKTLIGLVDKGHSLQKILFELRKHRKIVHVERDMTKAEMEKYIQKHPDIDYAFKIEIGGIKNE